MSRAAQLHNEVGPKIVVQICKAGPTPQDGLVLLESIVAGSCVYFAASTSGGLTAQQVFDLLVEGVRPRIDEICANVLKPKGTA